MSADVTTTTDTPARDNSVAGTLSALSSKLWAELQEHVAGLVLASIDLVMADAEGNEEAAEAAIIVGQGHEVAVTETIVAIITDITGIAPTEGQA